MGFLDVVRLMAAYAHRIDYCTITFEDNFFEFVHRYTFSNKFD